MAVKFGVGCLWLDMEAWNKGLEVVRVATMASVLDEPTRDVFSHVDRFGAVFVDPTLPTWANDFGDTSVHIVSYSVDQMSSVLAAATACSDLLTPCGVPCGRVPQTTNGVCHMRVMQAT